MPHVVAGSQHSAALVALGVLCLFPFACCAQQPSAPEYASDSAAFAVSVNIASDGGSLSYQVHHGSDWQGSLASSDWMAIAYSDVNLFSTSPSYFAALPHISYTLQINQDRSSPATSARCLAAADGFVAIRIAIMRAQAVARPLLSHMTRNASGDDAVGHDPSSSSSRQLDAMLSASPQGEVVRALWNAFLDGHVHAARLLGVTPLSPIELFLVAVGDDAANFAIAVYGEMLKTTVRPPHPEYLLAFARWAYNWTAPSNPGDVLAVVDVDAGLAALNRVGYLGDALLVHKRIRLAHTAVEVYTTAGAFMALSCGLTVTSANYFYIHSVLYRDPLLLVRQIEALDEGPVPLPFGFAASTAIFDEPNHDRFLQRLAADAAICPKKCAAVSEVIVVACGPRRDADRLDRPFSCGELVFVQHHVNDTDAVAGPTPRDGLFTISSGTVLHDSIDDVTLKNAYRAREIVLRETLQSAGTSGRSRDALMSISLGIVARPPTTWTRAMHPPWCATPEYNREYPSCVSPSASPFSVTPRFDASPKNPPVLYSSPLRQPGLAPWYTPAPRAVTLSAVVTLPDAEEMQLPSGEVRINTAWGIPGLDSLNRTLLAMTFNGSFSMYYPALDEWQLYPRSFPSSTEQSVVPIRDADLQTPVWITVFVTVTGAASFITVATCVLFYDPTPTAQRSVIMRVLDETSAYCRAVPVSPAQQHHQQQLAEPLLPRAAPGSRPSTPVSYGASQ